MCGGGAEEWEITAWVYAGVLSGKEVTSPAACPRASLVRQGGGIQHAGVLKGGDPHCVYVQEVVRVALTSLVLLATSTHYYPH